MSEIVVIGSLNMDLVVQTPRVPAAGETLLGTGFQLVPGGKGANQAVAASRAGASVRMIGCTGKDVFSEAIRSSLAAAGVDTGSLVEVQDQPTGVAAILVDASGENRIIIIPGANGNLPLQKAVEAVTVMKKGDLILLQHEIPLTVVHAVIRTAAATDVQVCLNPAPVFPIPVDLLALVDILVLNETEAETLSGICVNGRDTAREAASRLLASGVGTVIITLGSTGAFLKSGAEEIFQPAYEVTAVDTTAAGDTFTGYFTAARLQGHNNESSLSFAVAAAALAVTTLGAQSSIPTREEVEHFFQNHRQEKAGLQVQP